uniref:Uncharacterized protein n=1 Tax=Arundo donax TaxID=35708 RepID=A0A0A9HU11_ARUDO
MAMSTLPCLANPWTSTLNVFSLGLIRSATIVPTSSTAPSTLPHLLKATTSVVSTCSSTQPCLLILCRCCPRRSSPPSRAIWPRSRRHGQPWRARRGGSCTSTSSGCS